MDSQGFQVPISGCWCLSVAGRRPEPEGPSRTQQNQLSCSLARSSKSLITYFWQAASLARQNLPQSPCSPRNRIFQMAVVQTPATQLDMTSPLSSSLCIARQIRRQYTWQLAPSRDHSRPRKPETRVRSKTHGATNEYSAPAKGIAAALHVLHDAQAVSGQAP